MKETEQAFILFSMKTQVENGDQGDDAVNMIKGYIEEGFMSHEEALLMLKFIFYPEKED